MIRGGKGEIDIKTVLFFERKVDFLSLLKQIPRYESNKANQRVIHKIYYQDNLVARCSKIPVLYVFGGSQY